MKVKSAWAQSLARFRRQKQLVLKAWQEMEFDMVRAASVAKVEALEAAAAQAHAEKSRNGMKGARW
jgi:hypothetical protein